MGELNSIKKKKKKKIRFISLYNLPSFHVELLVSYLLVKKKELKKKKK